MQGLAHGAEPASGKRTIYGSALAENNGRKTKAATYGDKAHPGDNRKRTKAEAQGEPQECA